MSSDYNHTAARGGTANQYSQDSGTIMYINVYFRRVLQILRWLREGRGAVNSAMEPEPEDEEQAAAAAAATEAPDESTVAAARMSIAGHEIAVDSTALDVSGWGLTAAQVREVAGALPQARRRPLIRSVTH